ncbi:MAG TPA: dihydroorotase [Victivallales bacterium]|nr:dihydroorotase [Victivallales bacterium]
MKNSVNYILEGATVIDPRNGINEKLDIGIEAGVICDPVKVTNPVRVNLEGLVVTPGLIDMHVHLREPGAVDKETIFTGTRAAAAGGFTSIVAMPNTKPAADTPSTIDYLKSHCVDNAVVNVLPSGCITKNIAGQEMADIESLKNSGIVAITDDGKCVNNNELMQKAIKYAKTFGLPVLDHCEDEYLGKGGSVHDGYWASITDIKGIPSASETLMVVRNLVLAETVDWKVHIQHISAKESVAFIRDAQKRGIKVTAEVTPHHIALTDECIKDCDTNFKMNPPLRAEDDREKLIQALKDNIITVIATDHAPHTETEKQRKFASAPFGIIGLETALPVCMTELVHTGILSLPELISKFTVGPADVLGLNIGSIKEGQAADLTVINPDFEFTIDSNKFYSKARNTPFNGKKVKGKAVATLVEGKFVYSELKKIAGII